MTAVPEGADTKMLYEYTGVHYLLQVEFISLLHLHILEESGGFSDRLYKQDAIALSQIPELVRPAVAHYTLHTMSLVDVPYNRFLFVACFGEQYPSTLYLNPYHVPLSFSAALHLLKPQDYQAITEWFHIPSLLPEIQRQNV
jgi:hypothetical protein